MPYIGKNLVGILKDARASDIMTGDGSDTTLTLTDTPGSTNNVLVFLDGIRQTPVTDYTVMGRTLTFTTAPEAGVLVVALTGSASSIDPKMGSVTSSKIVDGMVGDAKIAGMAASKLTGALPAISGANLTNIPTTGIDNVTSDPTISENPSGGVGTIQLNQNSGEMFVCTDATAGANVWINVGKGSGDVKIFLWYGGRGLWGGGATVNTIDYVTIATTGNAIDFGDLTSARDDLAACSNSVRGLFGGGSSTNTIDYVTIASTGNALDFGDLTSARNLLASCSDGIKGVWAGGDSSGYVNIIDYVTIDTTGNALDFGDLTVTRGYLAGCSDATRGLFGGGFSPNTNTIDYVTIASTGNALDFGDLTVARRNLSACSSDTRGLFGGGYTGGNENIIDYVTIASTGNATDFGDLTSARNALDACANGTRGVFGGGGGNIIDYVTIASTGNALDFGDLTRSNNSLSSCSGA